MAVAGLRIVCLTCGGTHRFIQPNKSAEIKKAYTVCDSCRPKLKFH